MNLNNLTLLKARFGNDRNFNDLIDTLAAVNKPAQSMVQSQIAFLAGQGVKPVAHALGAVPSTHRVGIQVLTGFNDMNWPAGTIVDQDQIWYYTGTIYAPVVSSTADANYVYIIQSQAPASFYIFSNETVPVLTLIAPTKWSYQVYAALDHTVVQSTDPFIFLQPANQAVTAPAGLSFIIAADGTATVVYQWQVSSDSGNNWATASGGVYTGTTTNTLAISNSTGLNGYLYRCVVTNGLSNSIVSNTVALAVS